MDSRLRGRRRLALSPALPLGGRGYARFLLRRNDGGSWWSLSNHGPQTPPARGRARPPHTCGEVGWIPAFAGAGRVRGMTGEALSPALPLGGQTRALRVNPHPNPPPSSGEGVMRRSCESRNDGGVVVSLSNHGPSDPTRALSRATSPHLWRGGMDSRLRGRREALSPALPRLRGRGQESRFARKPPPQPSPDFGGGGQTRALRVNPHPGPPPRGEGAMRGSCFRRNDGRARPPPQPSPEDGGGG